MLQFSTKLCRILSLFALSEPCSLTPLSQVIHCQSEKFSKNFSSAAAIRFLVSCLLYRTLKFFCEVEEHHGRDRIDRKKDERGEKDRQKERAKDKGRMVRRHSVSGKRKDPTALYFKSLRLRTCDNVRAFYGTPTKGYFSYRGLWWAFVVTAFSLSRTLLRLCALGKI